MADQKTKSVKQRWIDLQPSKTMLAWFCAGTAVGVIIAGFTWGGWVTGGTARHMATTAGDDSRHELASVICVERFLAASDARAQLTALKAIDSTFRQRQFVEEGGWAVMPGREDAARQAADLCARVLASMEPDELATMPEPASALQ